MPTYLMTGAASGLGAAVTARLRDRGDRVVTVDLRDADVPADLGTVDGRAGAVVRSLALVDGPLAGLVPCAGLGPQVPDHALIASVNFFGAVAFLDGCVDALAAGVPSAAVAISSNSTTIDPTVDADLVAAFLASTTKPRARGARRGPRRQHRVRVEQGGDRARRPASRHGVGWARRADQCRCAGSVRDAAACRKVARIRCFGPLIDALPVPDRTDRHGRRGGGGRRVPAVAGGSVRPRLHRLRRRRHRRAAAARRDLSCDHGERLLRCRAGADPPHPIR